jgi:hypothetical protein
MYTGAFTEGNIMPKHRSIQDAMLLPAHQVSDELCQGWMFNKRAVLGLFVSIDQYLMLDRV